MILIAYVIVLDAFFQPKQTNIIQCIRNNKHAKLKKKHNKTNKTNKKKNDSNLLHIKRLTSIRVNKYLRNSFALIPNELHNPRKSSKSTGKSLLSAISCACLFPAILSIRVKSSSPIQPFLSASKKSNMIEICQILL